jgi:hypothetical protein
MFALRPSFETNQTGSSGFAQSDESTVISDHTRSVSGGFSTACDTWNTTGSISARRERNVALLVTARLTTERANNDLWPVAAGLVAAFE